MKHKICIAAITAAVLLGMGTLGAVPAAAMESTGIEDRNEQIANETVFPDPDAKYTVFSDETYEYRIYADFAVLTECLDREITAAVIPAEVKGVPVTGMMEEPFGFCRKLTSVTLPDSLQYFTYDDICCNTLVRLSTVSSGAVSVFTPAPSAPEPESPVPTVAEIIVSDTNPYYTALDGILYTKDLKTLVACPPACGIKELKLPEETESISDYAFCACLTLETAVIPDSIKHIHNGAFAACPVLKKVELPESITTISGDIFYYCTALSDVVFHGEVTKIGYGAFNECTALEQFKMPDTVEMIGYSAFGNAPCIQNDNGVHYVGNWVVGSDEDVRRADIKDGTVGISEMAFSIRRNVSYLNIPSSVQYLGLGLYGAANAETTSVIHFHGGYLKEKNLVSAKNATDIYIYGKDCEIYDSEKTLPAQYKYSERVLVEDADDDSPIDKAKDLRDIVNKYFEDLENMEKEAEYAPYASENGYYTTIEHTGDIVIHGYQDSTAQKYAEKYGRKFEVIEETQIAGDVDGNGKCSIADVVLLQKYLIGEKDAALPDWKAADLTNDGMLNAADLTMMKRLLLNGSI